MADYGKQFAALVIGMTPMLPFCVVFSQADKKSHDGSHQVPARGIWSGLVGPVQAVRL
jgi:hypothetical protein